MDKKNEKRGEIIICVKTPKGKKRYFPFYREDGWLKLKMDIRNGMQFKDIVLRGKVNQFAFNVLENEIERLQIIALLLSAGMAEKGNLDPLSYYDTLEEIHRTKKLPTLSRTNFPKIPKPYSEYLFEFLKETIQRDFNIALIGIVENKEKKS